MSSEYTELVVTFCCLLREGSVVVDFKILYDSVLHDEIVRLQEDLEIHHHIGTLPAKPINLTASKGE